MTSACTPEYRRFSSLDVGQGESGTIKDFSIKRVGGILMHLPRMIGGVSPFYRSPCKFYTWSRSGGRAQSARGRGAGNGWREKTPNTKRTQLQDFNSMRHKDLQSRKVDNEPKRTQLDIPSAEGHSVPGFPADTSSRSKRGIRRAAR